MADICYIAKCGGNNTITLWEIDGETVETVSDFIFLDSKVTADSDCSHEIKRFMRSQRFGPNRAHTNSCFIILC